jgi:hypothetical protein
VQQQVEQIMQEAQRPESPLTVMTADAALPADSNSAQQSALALLRPFLRVPEAEAQVAIAELLHGGPQELPVVCETAENPVDAEAAAKETKAVAGRRKA